MTIKQKDLIVQKENDEIGESNLGNYTQFEDFYNKILILTKIGFEPRIITL